MNVAALIASLPLLAGCAVERTPGELSVEGRAPHVTLLLCIFASCHIHKPEEQTPSDLAGVQEVPAPSPSVCKDESTPNPFASRLGFGVWAEGIGPVEDSR